MRFTLEAHFNFPIIQFELKRANHKPGSVLNDHPSSTCIAAGLKRLTTGRRRATAHTVLLSLAPNGVYTAIMSP